MIARFFSTDSKRNKATILPSWVGWWLLLLFVLVVLMMQIGAVTRLTESGLSMVEWRLIAGAFPPLSEQEWQRVFTLYKETAEYRSFPIPLSSFKSIFWWEYIHRMWGRLIGVVAVLPLLWLLWKGQLNFWWKKHLLLVISLGALQGGIGYWMVVSGLLSRLDVAPERLAIHLFMAITILIYLGFLIYKVWVPLRQSNSSSPTLLSFGVKTWVWFSTIWVVVLGLSGVLVAGLNAGFVYNSFPLMGESLLPHEYGNDSSGIWTLIFDDKVAAQLHHRMLAYGSFVVVGVQTYLLHFYSSLRLVLLSRLQLFVLTIQAMIGIATLLSVVWLPFALLHQLGALALLLISFFVWLEVQSLENIPGKIKRTTDDNHTGFFLRD